MSGPAGRDERLRRRWDKHAASYDREMGFFDRHLFRDSRDWVCSRAHGDVLEVAIGTGLNLPHYPAGVRLTGVEWSPAMLDIARRRAADLGVTVELREGDAQALDLPDAAFDTVACTFSLCAIPDHRQALHEMAWVLRPGGLLLLADHVEAEAWPARAAQRLIELITARHYATSRTSRSTIGGYGELVRVGGSSCPSSGRPMSCRGRRRSGSGRGAAAAGSPSRGAGR